MVLLVIDGSSHSAESGRALGPAGERPRPPQTPSVPNTDGASSTANIASITYRISEPRAEHRPSQEGGQESESPDRNKLGRTPLRIEISNISRIGKELR